MDCGYSFLSQGYDTTLLPKNKGGDTYEKTHGRKTFSVWDVIHRPAGKGEIEGTYREWDEADFLLGVPIETTSAKRVMRYAIAPDRVETINRKLDDVCWGTLVELTFSGRVVIDVDVICDWLKPIYEGEN